MRIVLLALLALSISAFNTTANAAKSGVKNAKANSRACASIRSDMHHKGGAYIPPGVKCGKRRAV